MLKRFNDFLQTRLSPKLLPSANYTVPKGEAPQGFANRRRGICPAPDPTAPIPCSLRPGQCKGRGLLLPFCSPTSGLCGGTRESDAQFSQTLLTPGMSYPGITRVAPTSGVRARKASRSPASIPHHPGSPRTPRTDPTGELLESLQTWVRPSSLQRRFQQKRPGSWYRPAFPSLSFSDL